MTAEHALFWFLLAGGVLVLMAVAGTLVARLPLSSSAVYLGLGVLLGPLALNKLAVHPIDDSAWVHRLAEVAVIVSLFTTGLKLRLPIRDGRWHAPLRLASVSMILTVIGVTAAGVWGLGLPLGAAVLLAGVLAPTDPVLASDVQLENPYDTDKVRFSLSGEAGMNDGTAFPIVMLGMGLLGLHPLGAWGWRWWAIDVLWATAAGLLIGGALGWLVARVVLYLRRTHQEAFGRDEFLALGLIGLSYGLAVWAKGYGFLAVFAAGLALRQVEMRQTPDRENGAEAGQDVAADSDAPEASRKPEELATDPEKAPAYLARAVLGFNEQLERILEVGLVVLVGAMLFGVGLTWHVAWFAPLLFLVIRPLSVCAGLMGRPIQPAQRRLIAWFGIRGIGSLYYLMYAIDHGLDRELAREVTTITLSVIAVSVVLHGVSVTPLMNLYQRTRNAPGPEADPGRKAARDAVAT